MRIGIDARCLEASKRAGVARYLKNILIEWDKSGIDHEVYLYFRSKEPTDVSFDHFKTRLLDPNCYLDNLVVEQIAMPKMAKKDSISIVFSPEYTTPVYAGMKRIVTLHDISYSTHPEWYSFSERVRLNSFSRLSAIKAAAILTVSDYSKSEIVKTYRVSPGKIHVTPVATENIFSKVDDKEIRARVVDKYDLANPFVLYIGSIFNRRRVPMLIKAFSKVMYKVPHDLVIVGQNLTHPYEDIEAIAKEVGVTPRLKRIIFVDEEDIAPLYSMADVFVYVSTYEGFGLPPLEAMACGTSVISSNVTSIPEVIGDAGILINPDDESALVDALFRLLTDENLRKTFEHKGLVRASQFSWTRTANETLAAIERLATGS